ncbi:TolC family protein [Thermodesulfobium sp.]
MRLLLTIFLIVFITRIAFANELITCDEYISRNNQYITALNELEKAKINLDIQKKELKKASEPEIHYHSGYDPGKGYITSGVSVSGNITDLFFNTNTNKEKIKLAEIEVKQKQSNLDDIERKLKIEYTAKINEIERLKCLLESLKAQLRLKETQEKIVQNRFDAGLITRDEVERVQSELIDIKSKIYQNNDDIKIKEMELSR